MNITLESKIKILEYKLAFEQEIHVRKEFEEGSSDLNYRLSFFRKNLVDNNSCSDSGVLAPLVGMISSMMAIECINIITGNKSSYENKLLIINGLTMSIDTLNTKRNLSCKENCVKAI